MSRIQTEWDQRLQRAASARHEPDRPVDMHMQRLRAEGLSNHQIATLTGRMLSEVNIALGPHHLRGR